MNDQTEQPQQTYGWQQPTDPIRWGWRAPPPRAGWASPARRRVCGYRRAAILSAAIAGLCLLVAAVAALAAIAPPPAAATATPAPRHQAAAAPTAPPTEDPGITACRDVAERSERVQGGGPPPTDAERAKTRRMLAASQHADLREVAAELERTKDGNLYEQAEASGKLVGACAAAGIRAGIGD